LATYVQISLCEFEIPARFSAGPLIAVLEAIWELFLPENEYSVEKVSPSLLN